jgi:hypothetical protein
MNREMGDIVSFIFGTERDNRIEEDQRMERGGNLHKNIVTKSSSNEGEK